MFSPAAAAALRQASYSTGKHKQQSRHNYKQFGKLGLSPPTRARPPFPAPLRTFGGVARRHVPLSPWVFRLDLTLGDSSSQSVLIKQCNLNLLSGSALSLLLLLLIPHHPLFLNQCTWLQSYPTSESSGRGFANLSGTPSKALLPGRL